ncbi:MAG: ABC transporter substrate-binding protein [Acidimicrobiales bacterium]
MRQSTSQRHQAQRGRHMRRRGSLALRPVAVGAAALGLTVGMLGAGAGIAGASAGTTKGTAVYKYAQYVGGHGKANQKLSPVTIGIVNQQTATNAVAPVWTTGADIAAEYLNQHTHGIDGHPVKLELCKIATSASTASKCGQQFSDDSKVTAIAAGPITVGNTALETALLPSGKPLVWSVSLSASDEKFKDGFILQGAITQVEAPLATFGYKYLHAKTVSIVYQANIPTEVEGATTIDDALSYQGVKTIYKVGFTAADTNFSVPFEAAHVATTTLTILVNSGGPGCSDAYLTLKSLGLATKVKMLANVPCVTPTIAKADGGTLPHDWYYGAANPLPGSPTKSVTVFDKIAAHYGHPTTGPNVWVANAFGQVLTIAKWDTQLLKAHKKLTTKNVMQKARSFKGPVAQGAGTRHIDCGSLSTLPAVCDSLVSFFENTAPNKFTPIAWYIGPPKGFKAPVTSTG